MKLISAILLLLLAPIAFAQQNYPRDIEISWTNASEYTDGSLIDAGDLVSVRIEIYRQNDSAPSFTATIPANGEGLVQTELFAGAVPSPGTYLIYGYSIVVDGTESDPSLPLPRKYTGKPLPPIIVTVN